MEKPRRCLSCEQEIKIAAAEVKPASTGSEMYRTMMPMLSIAISRCNRPIMRESSITAET